MSDLIELLELFNKRERYFLINYALGGFSLANQFRRALEVELGLAIPAEAFVAMDYDLEWLAASLLASKHSDGATNFDRVYEGVPGTYPDVDLLSSRDRSISLTPITNPSQFLRPAATSVPSQISPMRLRISPWLWFRADGKRIGRPPALGSEKVRKARRMLEEGASRDSLARVMKCSLGTVRRAGNRMIIGLGVYLISGRFS